MNTKMNATTRSKILKSLDIRSRMSEITELTPNERLVLLEEEDQSVYHHIPLKMGSDAVSADKLKGGIAAALEKAEKFAQTKNLTNVSFNLDYNSIEVIGHKQISDQELIKKHEKRVLERIKIEERNRLAQEKAMQARVKNKEEAQKEIERLKRQFKL